MSKKILSIILTIAMVASCFAIAANAFSNLGFEEKDEAGNLVENYEQIWTLGEPYDENGDGTWFSIPVYLTANYAVGPISFGIKVEGEGVALDYFEEESASFVDDWGGYEAQYNDESYIAIIPQITETTATPIMNPEELLIGTLYYNVDEGGSATISIVNDPKTEENPAGILVAARMSDDVMTGTPIVGQKTTVGDSVTIGSTAAADPVLYVIDGTYGVIDTDRTSMSELEITGEEAYVDGYLYGLDIDNNGDTVETVFGVENGSLNIIANSVGSDCGTGTIVQVLDTEGNVFSEYCLIIFGDVDGTGEADIEDATAIELHFSYMYGPEGEGRLADHQIFAADVDMSTEADIEDATIIELHFSYMYENGNEDMRIPANIYG